MEGRRNGEREWIYFVIVQGKGGRERNLRFEMKEGLLSIQHFALLTHGGEPHETLQVVNIHIPAIGPILALLAIAAGVLILLGR